MNRDQKAAVVEEVATQIQESEAVFAVDYRGISVPQAAELRTKLNEAGARFRIVKNTLTELSADKAGAESLKELLEGPTAFTFVSAEGDVALAAKALAQFRRETELLEFKGGVMGGDVLTVEQITELSRLPALDVLHGQLVGVIASPITGLVRGLNALIVRPGDPAPADRRAGPGGRRSRGGSAGGGAGTRRGSGGAGTRRRSRGAGTRREAEEPAPAEAEAAPEAEAEEAAPEAEAEPTEESREPDAPSEGDENEEKEG